MSFPMKSTTPDPLLLPRRPVRHALEPEPAPVKYAARRPAPHLFYERALQRPGSTQRIDVTDCLRFCHLRNGRFATVMVFDPDTIPIFEKAIAMAQEGVEMPRNAGLVPFGAGFVEVGAKPGVVLLRTGPARPGLRMWIGPGDELVALGHALAHFKQITAPRGAVSQER